MPTLQIGRLLYLDGDCAELQIIGIPLGSGFVGQTERLGDEKFGKDATGGIADEIGSRPLPEGEDFDLGVLTCGGEMLITGFATRRNGWVRGGIYLDLLETT